MKSTTYNHREADKVLASPVGNSLKTVQLHEFPSEFTNLLHEMGEACLSDCTGNPGTAPDTQEVLRAGHEQVPTEQEQSHKTYLEKENS